jgi:hypothetical protein
MAVVAGTYNDEIRRDKTLPCKTCPLGTTTMVEGADSPSDCQRKSCSVASCSSSLSAPVQSALVCCISSHPRARFPAWGLIHLYGANGGKKGVWGGAAAPKIE